MNINSYNYLNNALNYTSKTEEANKPAKTESTSKTDKTEKNDSFTLSNINVAEYLASRYSNLTYNVLDAGESFPEWYQNGIDTGFPLQELFNEGVKEVSGEYDINAVPANSHATFIPPALQEKMDVNTELAAHPYESNQISCTTPKTAL